VVSLRPYNSEHTKPNNLAGPSTSADAYNGRLYTTDQKSLIVSILSAGTFFGALMAGAIADWIGRRSTIILGSAIFAVGVAMQVASTSVGLLAGGRLIAGFGVGFVSAIIILYMSEIAPKKVRGAIVSGYQFCITIGLLLASVVNQSMKDDMSSRSYRIPMAIQFVWAAILAVGLFCLPESPRYWVKKERPEQAARALSKLRGQPVGSAYIKDELDELIANYRFEMETMRSGWMDCFRGGWSPDGNLRRVVLGMAMQMMQQWTGVNFSKSPSLFVNYLANHFSFLLRHLVLPAGWPEERLPHQHDHDGRERCLDAHLLLDH
jgi:sugar porter (SP) family MFS transporter